MYLLDTCAFIWSVLDDPRLPRAVSDILAGNEPVYVSMVTLWEIAIKKTTGKLSLRHDTFELEKICAEEDIDILPLKLRYFERIQKLPLIHRGPFARSTVLLSRRQSRKA